MSLIWIICAAGIVFADRQKTASPLIQIITRAPHSGDPSFEVENKGMDAVSIEAVLFLSLVIGALAVFAAALAHAEHVSGRAPAENTNTLQGPDRTESVAAAQVYKKAA
jgi:hypothetical protein